MLTVIGGSMILANPAHAADTWGPRDEMVKELASKLGLPESKVQSAMDSIHDSHEKNRAEKMQEQLNLLVSQGKITNSQKNAFIAKQAEMKKEFDAIRADTSLSAAQKREKVKTIRDAFRSWLTEQGLDKVGIMNGKFGHLRGGPH